jgi:hypothetical protein
MVCKLHDDPFTTIVPYENYCYTQQDDIKGMNFYIVPGVMTNRDPVVNMPSDFTHRHLTYGPLPYEGLRAWDESRVPDTPEEWWDIPVFMSSYAGNVVSWQAHVPYKFINGTKRQFHSLAHRYWEPKFVEEISRGRKKQQGVHPSFPTTQKITKAPNLRHQKLVRLRLMTVMLLLKRRNLAVVHSQAPTAPL